MLSTIFLQIAKLNGHIFRAWLQAPRIRHGLGEESGRGHLGGVVQGQEKKIKKCDQKNPFSLCHRN